MGRQRWLSGLVGGFLIFMLLASPTAAVVPLTATISKHATLLEGGQAVWVEVTVTCDPAQG